MLEYCGVALRPGVPPETADRLVDAMVSNRCRSGFTGGSRRLADGVTVGWAYPDIWAPLDGVPAPIWNGQGHTCFGSATIYEDPVAKTPALERLCRHVIDQGDPAALSSDFSVGLLRTDTTSLRLFGDQIGVRTLYYRDLPEGLAFASNLHFLAAAGLPQLEPDPRDVAVFALVRRPRPGRCILRDIRVLRPAHMLDVEAGEVRAERRYWALEGTQDHGYRSHDDCVQHVQEVFERAVRHRQADARHLGIALSGGLDSSAVAGVAAQDAAPGSIVALSYVPGEDRSYDPNEQNDDRPYIQAMLDHLPALTPRPFTSDSDDLLATVEDAFTRSLLPSSAPNTAGRVAMAREAHDAGVDVVLHGLFGDDFLSNFGDTLLPEALLSGRLGTAWQQLRRLGGGTLPGMMRALRTNLFRPLIPRTVRSMYRAVRNKRWERSVPINPSWLADAELTEDVAELTMMHPLHVPSTMKSWMLQAMNCGIENDLIHQDRASGNNAYALRYPMLDVHLLRAVFWTPADHFASPETDRALIRNVSGKFLPTAVRHRTGKAPFMPDFDQRLIAVSQTMHEVLEEALSDPLIQSTYNIGQLTEISQKLNGLGQSPTQSFDFVSVMFRVYMPFAMARYSMMLQA